MMSTVKSELPDRKDASEPNSHEPDSVPEKVTAAVKGDDQPMEKEHPQAPGALVWFTYPVILIVVLLIAMALFAIFKN